MLHRTKSQTVDEERKRDGGTEGGWGDGVMEGGRGPRCLPEEQGGFPIDR